MKFDRLQPGMVVWDVVKRKMGNTIISTTAVFPVKVVSVDPVSESVMASWNGNAPKKFSGRSIGKWRLNKPLLIHGSHGYARLATREEIAQHKAETNE